MENNAPPENRDKTRTAQEPHANLLAFFLDLHKLCRFQTTDRGGGVASNSEVRRWFENKAIIVNGTAAHWKDPVPDEWLSLVIFPKGRRRCTLWHTPCTPTSTPTIPNTTSLNLSPSSSPAKQAES